MYGLILETSTEKGCIVLSKEGKPCAFHRISGGRELSKTIATEVARLLKEFSCKPDFIAVGTGPGSYTGIRVGAALGKALAFGWDIPLLGFCSLQAFFPSDGHPYAVVVDARMGGFYLLKTSLDTPILISPAEAPAIFSSLSGIASPHLQTLQKRLELKIPSIETDPDPTQLAMLCNRLLSEESKAPFTLTYLSAP